MSRQWHSNTKDANVAENSFYKLEMTKNQTTSIAVTDSSHKETAVSRQSLCVVTMSTKFVCGPLRPGNIAVHIQVVTVVFL